MITSPFSRKKRLLIVTLNFPYPLNNGGAIAQQFFIDGLLNKFDIYIATSVRDPQIIEEFNRHYPAIVVKNLFDSSQETKPGLLFTLKLALSRALKKLRGSSNVLREDHLESEYIKNLLILKSERFITLLDMVIRQENIEIVQLEFFETLDLVLSIPKEVATLFVAHELRAKRVQIAAEFSSTSKAYQNYLLNLTQLYEYSLLRRCAGVVVFNDDDKQLLSTHDIKSFLSPYGIPPTLHKRKSPSTSFKRLLFLGGESHFPNKEGLTWFLDNIYLQAEMPPSMPLVIIGEWSPEYKLKYSKYNYIRFLGQQLTIYNHFNESILVAPILSGSGLRTKILDAFVNYMPVFCTPFASEGIDFEPNSGICLYTFTSKPDFQALLLNDDGNLTEVAKRAKQFYDTHFDADKLVEKRLEVYQSLRARHTI